MQTKWVFHGCEEWLKAELRRYWEKKEHRLERLLCRFPGALRELDISVYRHPPAPTEVRAALHLPTGALVAERSGDNERQLLDGVADKLTREAARHREKIRRDWVYRRKARRREEAAGNPSDARYPYQRSGALSSALLDTTVHDVL